MNWITRVIRFGEKIKKVVKERTSKEEILQSNWISCCAGPVLKKEIFNDETQQMQDWELYTFTLGHDNMVEMYDINNPPVSDFTFVISEQGSPPVGTPPIANFNHQAL